MTAPPSTSSPRSSIPLRLPSRPALVVAIAAAVVAVLAYMVGEALAAFVVAGVLVVLVDPLVGRLARWGVPRALAAIIGIALVIVIVIAFLLIVFRAIVEQGIAFVSQIPDWVDSFVGWYETANLAPEVRAVLDQVIADVAEAIAAIDYAAIILGFVSSILGIVGSVLGLLAIPFFMFFVLADRPRLVRSLQTSIPGTWRGDLLAIGRIGLGSLATYFRAEAILVVVLFGITFLGLMGLSILVDDRIAEFALFLAVVAGFSELIPMFGPYIAFIPAFLFGLTLGPEALLGIVVLYLIIMFLEGQVLVPTIEGKSFAIHPAAVLVLILAGLALLGPLGAILALPVAAAGRDIFRYTYRRSAGSLDAPLVTADGRLAPDPLETLQAEDEAAHGQPSADAPEPEVPTRPEGGSAGSST
jgi:predicted PurR-regulated permease PerM